MPLSFLPGVGGNGSVFALSRSDLMALREIKNNRKLSVGGGGGGASSDAKNLNSPGKTDGAENHYTGRNNKFRSGWCTLRKVTLSISEQGLSQCST